MFGTIPAIISNIFILLAIDLKQSSNLKALPKINLLCFQIRVTKIVRAYKMLLWKMVLFEIFEKNRKSKSVTGS